VNLPVRLNLSPYVSVERLPATGASPLAGKPFPRNWFTTPATIYRAGKIESRYVPMSLRLGPGANVFLLCEFHRRPLARDIRITGRYMVRLIPPGMVDRNVGPVCLNAYTTLWHNIIRLLGFGVPKTAAAQGNSGRHAPSRLSDAAAERLHRWRIVAGNVEAVGIGSKHGFTVAAIRIHAAWASGSLSDPDCW
jgi:hypothetical protein